MAVGDALGLQVEGCSAEEVAARLERTGADHLSLPYTGSYRGYEPNDWTDATDMAVLALRTLRRYETDEKGVIDPERELAIQISRWIEHGFSELRDTEGVGVENVVARAAGISDFTTNPREAAADVKPPRATNGALPRAVAAAAAADTPAAAADWARLLTGVTHADSTSQAASVALAVLLWELLWPAQPTTNSACPAAGATAARAGAALLKDGARAPWVKALGATATLKQIELGSTDGGGRTLAMRATRAAFWAYRALLRGGPAAANPETARALLAAVAAEGGDASMNCAVAGAVIGAALGAAALPRDWLSATPARAWLRGEVAAWVTAVETDAEA